MKPKAKPNLNCETIPEEDQCPEERDIRTFQNKGFSFLFFSVFDDQKPVDCLKCRKK